MGISNGITLRGGVQLNDSYLNIRKYDVFKQNKSVSLFLNVYKDKSSRDSNEETVMPEKKYEIPLEFYENELAPLLSQIEGKLYLYLKGLPEYSSFNDILES